MLFGRGLSRFFYLNRPSPKVAGRGSMIGQRWLASSLSCSGIPWELLPAAIGSSGMTCWRRLRDWQAAGVWMRLHRILLERLADADKLDWSRASLDSCAIAAKRGALPPTRTRRIAANRARSTRLWSTGRAHRSV
jgi:transposase